MTDEEFFSATTELRTIYQWARARYAAPWAVFGAVLLRVSASTGPEVQLPGIIGGRASLNLLAAFVSPSGGGKGISDKVAREVWPDPIIERPIGSGEGIAATFMPPKKDGQEPITRAIFSVPEIDTLAGIAGRQGSILLAQLKSMAMGELLGQSNASDATTRIVQAHTYRCCLSVGAQPGHCGVIFSDTSGGTPQRFLWFPTTDPDMPASPASDPGPLNTSLPPWARLSTEAMEIEYGPEEIAQTVIAAHIARQRGDSEALDGHALLTRCKVAAVLAVMHHRSVVSELDWQLSETVMAVSDRTRDWILSEAKRADREKARARALRQAEFNDVIDNRLLDGVKNSIIRTLERDGEQAGNALRSRMGKRERRDLFDQAVSLLEHEGRVAAITVERGVRYRLTGVQGEPPVRGQYSHFTEGEPKVQGEPEATVTDLDSRRSHDSEPPKLTGRAWLANHLADLRAAGHTTAESFAVLDAGEAAGFARQTIRVAASDHPDITVIGRNGKVAVWDITGTRKTKHTSAADWTANYLDNLARDGIDVVDKEQFRHAATAAGYSWTSARHAATDSGRIESVPGTGSETIWKIVQPADAEDAS
ncbi:hypothetical protein [Mycolicibacterium farcinogenes]|uniref:Uncharacterized protein n=1 Tax=Mycolicibacterium farcinogenes TaxID=1802 RepID=A0ACD1FIT3_MYCFR|nr:hypothetical protein [Mycolicibacterium farcinogenes]QZH66932.1 hypothetical protein K6L26_04410 [Mycolicibacterium farcinogenes]